MLLKQYIEASQRTNHTGDTLRDSIDRISVDKSFHVEHAIQGIITEAGELSEAFINKGGGANILEKIDEIDWVNVSEEIGDLLWYIALLLNTISENLDCLQRKWDFCLKSSPKVDGDLDEMICRSLIGMYVSVGRIVDLQKKHINYNCGFSQEDILCELFEDDCALMKNIFSICKVLKTKKNISVHGIMKKNVDKLRERYPEKFSYKKANARNLDGERKKLEDEKCEILKNIKDGKFRLEWKLKVSDDISSDDAEKLSVGMAHDGTDFLLVKNTSSVQISYQEALDKVSQVINSTNLDWSMNPIVFEKKYF